MWVPAGTNTWGCTPCGLKLLTSPLCASIPYGDNSYLSPKGASNIVWHCALGFSCKALKMIKAFFPAITKYCAQALCSVAITSLPEAILSLVRKHKNFQVFCLQYFVFTQVSTKQISMVYMELSTFYILNSISEAICRSYITFFHKMCCLCETTEDNA